MTEKIPRMSSSRQKTITGSIIDQETKPRVKSSCQFCKVKVLDIKSHESKCHRNNATIPLTDYDWDYFEEYDQIREFLIKEPITKKMKEFNQILAPQGNPFEHITDAMLPYMKKLPKNHLEKQMLAKLHEDFSRGIELRLLTEDEFIQRLEEKVKKGYQIPFLRNRPDEMSTKQWIDEVSKISCK